MGHECCLYRGKRVAIEIRDDNERMMVKKAKKFSLRVYKNKQHRVKNLYKINANQQQTPGAEIPLTHIYIHPAEQAVEASTGQTRTLRAADGEISD